MNLEGVGPFCSVLGYAIGRMTLYSGDPAPSLDSTGLG